MTLSHLFAFTLSVSSTAALVFAWDGVWTDSFACLVVAIASAWAWALHEALDLPT